MIPYVNDVLSKFNHQSTAVKRERCYSHSGYCALKFGWVVRTVFPSSEK